MLKVEDTIIPQVNLNGTSKAVLFSQYKIALERAIRTKKAVVFSAPHGRDYQTLSDGVFNKAMLQHTNRLVDLERIIKELVEIAASLI